MRVFDYIIVCKTSDFKRVDRISQFMLLLTIIGLSFGIYKGFFPKPALIIAIISSVFCWALFCLYQQKKGGQPYYRLGLLFASWGWFLMPKALLIAGVYLIAALFERQVKFPYEIAFDTAGIVINSFPKKHYPWSAIQNALIKDDIITIDFKNNRLIQKEINEPVTEAVSAEFNAFCAQQINH